MVQSLKVSDNSLETQEFLESPRPLLSKSKESLLSARQKEAILGLEELIEAGYPQLTMSQIANRLKVSLRTLYKIAPKKEDLLLIAVDRLLFKIGAEAQQAINTGDGPLEKLKIFLHKTNEATKNDTLAFTEDFDKIQGARALIDSHENYVVNLTKKMLDEAIEAGEINKIDTSWMSLVLSGLTRETNRKYLKKASKAETADSAKEMMEIIFKGLKSK
ncbi:TetR/AcrR family transcriptional regulator [Gammaproteobacteria bacterium]|nr:TetR/AcrR family transcriptional regulator [Gammaproteobacteria bacterium]